MMVYYGSLNYKSEEEINKIYIIKKINYYHSGHSYEFTLDVWKTLKQKQKEVAIKDAISLYKSDNVIISLSVDYYVRELDAMYMNYIHNRDKNGMGKIAISVSFPTIAAMEGDWNDGDNKVSHAMDWMGPNIFNEFKRLFPIKYNKLLEL